MPDSGFLGTRADLLIDSVLVFFLAAPFLMAYAIHIADRGRYPTHRNFQVALLVGMVIAVLALELGIRAGRASEALAASRFSGTLFVYVLFGVHLMVAIPTLLSWIALEVLSWRRFPGPLPGRFSAVHKRWGRVTFIGLCLTSVTGAGLYVVSFAL